MANIQETTYMKREWYWVIAILVGVIALFFHQTIFWRKVPFPGDILASDFQPWRSTSYLGYGEGGIPNKAQYPDVIRQIYPWKTLVVDSLKQGKLPLWNPYNFSGAPLLANFQSAALYPLNIFYFLLSKIDAWTILIVLQPLLATLFTYLYSRKVGIGTLGSWLASLSYGFSGFMAVWLEYNTVGHVILWLPLIMLAVEHLRDKPKTWWLAVLTFSHAAALLAGHPQVYAYTLVFTTIYAMTRVKRKLPVFVFTALGIGITGIQIIPGVELIANAARSPHDPSNLFTKILIQPWQLLSLPFPNFFGNPATRTYFPTDTFVGKVTTIGLVPLFFSFSAFRRKDALTKWFILATGLVLLLITANPVTYLLYKIPLPLFTSSSPTLMSFLLAFSLAVLCGMGLDFWMTDKHSMKKLFFRSVQVVLILLALGFIYRNPVTTRALFYGGLVSGATLGLFWVAIAFSKFRAHAIAVLLVVHVLDLFMFFNRFNPFVPKALVFPDHPVLTYLKEKSPDRYWGYGTAAIAANFASQYRIFSPEGYDPLYPIWYGQFLYNTTTFTNATRSDAAIESHFGDGGLSDTNKQNVLNALSVRYILDRDENAANEQIYPPTIFQHVHEFSGWHVYENKDAKPRAYVENGTAAILSYASERIVIETESNADSTLVLTDTYYPDWKATIDGNPTEILRTNHTLRGISVPAGKHIVSFVYQPISVRIGVLLSIVSIGTAIIGLFVMSRKYA